MPLCQHSIRSRPLLYGFEYWNSAEQMVIVSIYRLVVQVDHKCGNTRRTELTVLFITRKDALLSRSELLENPCWKVVPEDHENPQV